MWQSRHQSAASGGILTLSMLEQAAQIHRLTAMLENGIHYHPALVEKLIKHAGE